MITIDYHIEVIWAYVQACAYTTFHWRARIYTENTWLERMDRNYLGGWRYDEKMTFIGVVKGSILTGDLQVVKEYYGKTRFPPEHFNAKMT